MQKRRLFSPLLFDGTALFDTGIKKLLYDLFLQLGEPEARWFSETGINVWETDDAAMSWAAEALPLAWLCSTVAKNNIARKKC